MHHDTLSIPSRREHAERLAQWEARMQEAEAWLHRAADLGSAAARSALREE
jgi:hypothetical protein